MNDRAEEDKLLGELLEKVKGKLITEVPKGPNKHKNRLMEAKATLHNYNVLWDHKNDKPSLALELLKKRWEEDMIRKHEPRLDVNKRT